MKNDLPAYEKIRTMVEKTCGFKLATHKDYCLLTTHIFNRTQTMLSTTTLKRFWGKVEKADETKNIRTSTLDVLSRYVGYSSWEDFLNAKVDSVRDISVMQLRKKIKVSDLDVGRLINLNWLPDRRITIRYEGENIFSVQKSENSKLKEGDFVQIDQIVANQPLFMSNLLRKGLTPTDYLCAQDGSLTFELV